MNMKHLVLVGFFAVAFGIHGAIADAQNPSDQIPAAAPPEVATKAPMVLPAWKAPADSIPLTPEFISGKVYDIWGPMVAGRQSVYFDEMLPALFERTLEIKERPAADSPIRWILTGPRAGIDVTVQDGKLTVAERYYDSSLYRSIQKQTGKHSEWRSSDASVAYTGDLKALTVSIDSRFNLSVALNGLVMWTKKWQEDLQRHQVTIDGQPTQAVRVLVPAAVRTTVTVDPARTHQNMIGFGGSVSVPAYARLSEEGKRRWWNLISEFNLLIQREYPNSRRLNAAMDNWDDLNEAVPHYYGSNFPNGEISDFQYNRLIRALGGQVWFEFWKLPAVAEKDLDQYAKAMVAYCRDSTKKSGAPPEIVGVQNEIVQPAETFNQMTRKLRAALDANGFEQVKIHMANANSMWRGVGRAKDLRQAPDAWKMTDYAATNIYDFQSRFQDLDQYDRTLRQWRQAIGDKPFLAVEICINKVAYAEPSYRNAFNMAQLYHKNLTIANAAALLYCWTLLDVIEGSYGWTRTLFVIDWKDGKAPVPGSYEARAFGSYSRRVRAGMTRVEAAGDQRDLLVTAFAGPEGQATLVAVNRSLRPMEVEIAWPGVNFREIEITDPYHPNTAKPVSSDKSVVIEPGAIVTLTTVPLSRLPDNFFENLTKKN